MNYGMSWKDFIDQDMAKRELMAIARSKIDGTSILIRGQYGSGKTALARLTAGERGLYTFYDVPPAIEEMRIIGKSAVIDEIHLCARPEIYYNLMASDTLMIFCTTDTSGLSDPFKSRCTPITLLPYSNTDIGNIIVSTMRKWGTTIKFDKAMEIAKRSHGNPRVALTLARRVHRLIRSENRPFTISTVLAEFGKLGIDGSGFDNRHRAYLALLMDTSSPIGLSSIATYLELDKTTLLQEVEPALLRSGKIFITSRGRKLR